MNRQNSTLKKAMLKALESTLGVVTTAAEKAGIDRTTHYLWLKNDEEYKNAVDDLKNIALDFAESKLHERISGVKVQRGSDVYESPPSDTAIIFYLKTQGKGRGYIERQEVEHSNKEPLTIKVINAGN